jgi:hypothetical protein
MKQNNIKMAVTAFWDIVQCSLVEVDDHDHDHRSDDGGSEHL